MEYPCTCGGPSVEDQQRVFTHVNELRLPLYVSVQAPFLRHHYRCFCGMDFSILKEMIFSAALQENIEQVGSLLWYWGGKGITVKKDEK